MLKALLLLTACVAPVVVARSSPNAASVQKLYKSHSGSRYSDNILEDAELDAPGLIAKYGYPVEIHSVVTEDGYILEMHRIPHGRDNNSNPEEKREAILVMHGLLSSSADFLSLGPESALGYHLAEAGYDVWFGNARGNFYSRHHLSLDPERNDFWKFSWDEIGNYDLPAFIDYILATTGNTKIHYAGHSQGGTSFLCMAALRPEYNDKLISFQALAPASFFSNTENKTFKNLAPFESVLESAAWALGFGEIFGSPEFMDFFQEQICRGSTFSTLDSFCKGGLGSSLSENEYFNSTMLPVILGHSPAGASIRQVAHYGQVIRFDAFRRYNYPLSLTNLAVYGRLNPPAYDLTKITTPTYLHYGLGDSQVNYKDVLKLASHLPNVVKLNQMKRSSFNHFDFIWAIDATEQLYNYVVEFMKEAEITQLETSYDDLY